MLTMLTIDKNTWQVDPKYFIKVKMTACIKPNLRKVTFHLLWLGQKNIKGSQFHIFHKYANTTITIFRFLYNNDLVKKSWKISDSIIKSDFTASCVTW